MSTSTTGCGRATARSSTDSSPWRAATPEGSPVRRGGGQARHRILAGARPLARLATARWARAQPVQDGIQLAVHPVKMAVDLAEPVAVPGLGAPHIGQRIFDIGECLAVLSLGFRDLIEHAVDRVDVVIQLAHLPV